MREVGGPERKKPDGRRAPLPGWWGYHRADVKGQGRVRVTCGRPANPGDSSVTTSSDARPPSAYFNVLIEDHVRWDGSVFLPPEPQPAAAGRPRSEAWLQAALATAAFTRENRQVDVTDLDLATYRYGGDPTRWPRRARGEVRKSLTELIPDARTGRCSRWSCAWRGRSHRHWEVFLPDSLCGAVSALAADPDGEDDFYPLDFDRRLPRKKDLEGLEARLASLLRRRQDAPADGPANGELEAELDRRTARIRQAEQGLGDRLIPVYLPALLLGTAAGLSQRQTYLLTSLAREVTRRRGRNKREDRALVFTAGGRATPCPFLTPGQRYVAFDGQNGFRSTCRAPATASWSGARRAYYADERVDGEVRVRAMLRQYLRDLADLRDEFGLVVAYRRKDGVWRSLDEPLQLSRLQRRLAAGGRTRPRLRAGRLPGAVGQGPEKPGPGRAARLQPPR